MIHEIAQFTSHSKDGVYTGKVLFRYDPDDPCWQELHFESGSPWRLPRRALATGLEYPIELVDVEVRPFGTTIALTLSGEGFDALVLIHASHVERFVSACGLADVERLLDSITQEYT